MKKITFFIILCSWLLNSCVYAPVQDTVVQDSVEGRSPSSALMCYDLFSPKKSFFSSLQDQFNDWLAQRKLRKEADLTEKELADMMNLLMKEEVTTQELQRILYYEKKYPELVELYTQKKMLDFDLRQLAKKEVNLETGEQIIAHFYNEALIMKGRKATDMSIDKLMTAFEVLADLKFEKNTAFVHDNITNVANLRSLLSQGSRMNKMTPVQQIKMVEALKSFIAHNKSFMLLNMSNQHDIVVHAYKASLGHIGKGSPTNNIDPKAKEMIAKEMIKAYKRFNNMEHMIKPLEAIYGVQNPD